VIDGIKRVLESVANPHYWIIEPNGLNPSSILPGSFDGIVIRNTNTNQILSLNAGTQPNVNDYTIFCRLHPEIPAGRTIDPSNGKMDNGDPNPYSTESSPINVGSTGVDYYALNGAGNAVNSLAVTSSAVSIVKHSYLIELPDAIIILLTRRVLVSGSEPVNQYFHFYCGCMAGKILAPDHDESPVDGSGLLVGIGAAGLSSNIFMIAKTYSVIRKSVIRINNAGLATDWDQPILTNSVIIEGTTPTLHVGDLNTAWALNPANVLPTARPLGFNSSYNRFVPYTVEGNTAGALGYLKYMRHINSWITNDTTGFVSGVTKYLVTPSSSKRWIHYVPSTPGSNFALNTVFPWSVEDPVLIDP
jgi:hypothetical protein